MVRKKDCYIGKILYIVEILLIMVIKNDIIVIVNILITIILTAIPNHTTISIIAAMYYCHVVTS